MDKKKVLVTGATGYVAGWLVEKLLREGHTVHAAVRDPKNTAKIQHLLDLEADRPGQLVFFQSDLLKDGSYAEAMEGCEVVYHTASPFTSNYKDPQKELIEPAVKGTENVLNQATQTPSVKRVVVTSSCAAIYTDCTDIQNTPNNILTEEVWNTTASLDYQPYSYSKTLAEKAAWKIAKGQSQWTLVTMNPPMVMGPALNPSVATSESVATVKQMGDGTLRMGAPNLGVGAVDIRDLAEAHYRGGFMPEAEGRYIISGHNSSFLEMAQLIHAKYGDKYPVPNKAVPKWLLMIVGPVFNKMITRQFIRNNVNREWKADNSKSVRELGMAYRPLSETMTDAFQSLIDGGVLPKK